MTQAQKKTIIAFLRKCHEFCWSQYHKRYDSTHVIWALIASSLCHYVL